MDKVLGDKKAIAIFVIPGFLLFFFVILLPIGQSTYFSLLKWDGITEPIFIGLRNYVMMFSEDSKLFASSIGNSLTLAALSVFLQLPLALLLALILANGIRGEKTYRTIYFIPVIISTVIIGQLWMKIYHPNYGLLNVFLDQVGLGSWKREWLGKKETALAAAFVPMIWQYVGYHLLLFYTAAKSIPTEMKEAARVDGAGGITIALRIVIPQIMPMIKTCVIFAVIGSLKSFDLIYVLTKGGPMHATEVPSTLMYNNIFVKYSFGSGSSMAIFIILECLVLTVLIQKAFPKEAVV
ncbi:sugar ABC transporter permease [Treponema sp.]